MNEKYNATPGMLEMGIVKEKTKAAAKMQGKKNTE
jgi:hypothetical protein